MKASERLPGTFASSILWSSLIDEVKWLRQASEVVFVCCKSKRCGLGDAQEVLAIPQVLIFCYFCCSLKLLNLQVSCQQYSFPIDSV